MLHLLVLPQPECVKTVQEMMFSLFRNKILQKFPKKLSTKSLLLMIKNVDEHVDMMKIIPTEKECLHLCPLSRHTVHFAAVIETTESRIFK